jgi:hypothetical protein
LLLGGSGVDYFLILLEDERNALVTVTILDCEAGEKSFCFG